MKRLPSLLVSTCLSASLLAPTSLLAQNGIFEWTSETASDSWSTGFTPSLSDALAIEELRFASSLDEVVVAYHDLVALPDIKKITISEGAFRLTGNGFTLSDGMTVEGNPSLQSSIETDGSLVLTAGQDWRSPNGLLVTSKVEVQMNGPFFWVFYGGGVFTFTNEIESIAAGSF